MPSKKKRRSGEKRASDRYKAMPEWKRKKHEMHKAGIKSGTEPERWRDPKTGAKARVPPRYVPPEPEAEEVKA